jgi:hypothetical protein
MEIGLDVFDRQQLFSFAGFGFRWLRAAHGAWLGAAKKPRDLVERTLCR